MIHFLRLRTCVPRVGVGVSRVGVPRVGVPRLGVSRVGVREISLVTSMSVVSVYGVA